MNRIMNNIRRHCLVAVLLTQLPMIAWAGGAPKKGTYGYELWKNDLPAIKRRFNKNPKLVNAEDEYGATPLWEAAINGNMSVVQYLLSLKANPNKGISLKYSPGETPLMGAIRGRHLEIAKYLVARGAQPNAKDRKGDTALHRATKYKYAEGVEFLLANGANANIGNNARVTPLHNAVLPPFQSVKIVRALLDKGANPNAKDKAGKTPISLVRDNKELVKKNPQLLAVLEGKSTSR